MDPHTYHNTNRLSGASLDEAESQAKTQEELVLEFFQSHHKASPSTVKKQVFRQSVPITSIRRAISNLTRDGHLIKTEKKVEGMYGKPEHVWRLSPIHAFGTQEQLFKTKN